MSRLRSPAALMRAGAGLSWPLRLESARLDPGALRFAINAVLALALASQAARLVWTLATPIGPIGDPVAAETAPPPRVDLAALTRIDPFFRTGGAAGADSGLDPTQLGLVLFAVRAGGADGGAAIIAVPDRGQRAFAIGDEVAPGVVLEAIGPDYVSLRRDGVLQDLRFPAPVSPASAAPTPSGPAPAAGDAMIRVATTIDPGALISELALQARIENGEVTGYVLREGRGGPLLERLGLRPGDVLLEVNNSKLVDDERVSELESELRSRPETQIRYERGGEVRVATVRVSASALAGTAR